MLLSGATIEKSLKWIFSLVFLRTCKCWFRVFIGWLVFGTSQKKTYSLTLKSESGSFFPVLLVSFEVSLSWLPAQVLFWGCDASGLPYPESLGSNYWGFPILCLLPCLYIPRKNKNKVSEPFHFSSSLYSSISVIALI